VYYLTIVKEMFFFSPEYKRNPILNDESSWIVMSSPMAITISIISLAILLFIFMNKEWLSMGTILVLFLFNS
jgi:NADH-ubiquinone oxidoreductase chain 2